MLELTLARYLGKRGGTEFEPPHPLPLAAANGSEHREWTSVRNEPGPCARSRATAVPVVPPIDPCRNLAGVWRTTSSKGFFGNAHLHACARRVIFELRDPRVAMFAMTRWYQGISASEVSQSQVGSYQVFQHQPCLWIFVLPNNPRRLLCR